jgi:hypothetical protein
LLLGVDDLFFVIVLVVNGGADNDMHFVLFEKR